MLCHTGGNKVLAWWQKQPVLCDTRPYAPYWVALWVDRGTSLLILLATLMKPSAWSSGAFNIAFESILITNVPANCSRLDDQSHSLLTLWERVVFIAEEDHCRDINLESKCIHGWDEKRRICSSSHSHTNAEALSPLTALMHNIQSDKKWLKPEAVPLLRRKSWWSQSLYRNTAGEQYGQVAEGSFLQFFPICTGNLNENFQN